MEVVDRSMRETLRRLKAESIGGVTTRYSTKHLRIHQNPIMLTFVRMTGMSNPWAIAFGRALDSEPRILSVVDPRQKGAIKELAQQLAPSLLNLFGVAHFSDNPLKGQTIKPEDMPQLWLADEPNLAMLHALNFAFFEPRAGVTPTQLGTFGRLCGFLFEHSFVVGHQLVVNATELLNNLYVIPADDHFASHLAATIAWIDDPNGQNRAREAAIATLLTPSGVTLDPAIENEIVAKLEDDPDDMTPSAKTRVKDALAEELLKRWGLMKRSWQIANDDSRRENAEVSTLVVDSLVAYRQHFQGNELEVAGPGSAISREPETDNDATQASLNYLRALEAEDKFVSHMVHDDRELLGDLFYDGSAFMGKMIAIDREKRTWSVQLDPKFGRLLKKRESEVYCLIGRPTERTATVTGFKKVVPQNGGEELWVIEMTWSKDHFEKSSKSTIFAEHDSEEWLNQKVIFVPSYASHLHESAQKIVSKAHLRAGGWLLEEGAKSE